MLIIWFHSLLAPNEMLDVWKDSLVRLDRVQQTYLLQTDLVILFLCWKIILLFSHLPLISEAYTFQKTGNSEKFSYTLST